MSGIKTLIKLAKSDLEERRKRLGMLLHKQETLEMAIRMIEEENEREISLAGNDLSYAAFLNCFIKLQAIKRQAAEKALQENANMISSVEEEIYQAFTELKKLEIAKTNRDKREMEKTARAEEAFLDDVALRGFVRNTEN